MFKSPYVRVRNGIEKFEKEKKNSRASSTRTHTHAHTCAVPGKSVLFLIAEEVGGYPDGLLDFFSDSSGERERERDINFLKTPEGRYLGCPWRQLLLVPTGHHWGQGPCERRDEVLRTGRAPLVSASGFAGILDIHACRFLRRTWRSFLSRHGAESGERELILKPSRERT